jgi:hypothetical protein
VYHVPLPKQLDRTGNAIVSRPLNSDMAHRLLGFVPVPLIQALADTVGVARAIELEGRL